MSKKKREIKEIDKNKKEIDKGKKSCVCSGNSLRWIFLFIAGGIIGILIGYWVGLRQPKEIVNQQPREVEYPTKTEVFENAEILRTFIGNHLINEGQKIELVNIEEVSGLYRMNFEIIDDGPIKFYITRDGKFLIDGRGIENFTKIEWRVKSDQFHAALTPERKVKIAQCLTERGFKVYVADWCPFCRQQKKLFGEAAKYLTSIDCYDPDGPRRNIAKCPHIRGVPAWKDGEGKMLPYEGMLCIKRLVKLSGCAF